GGSRNHGYGGGPCAAQISVGNIKNHLVVGVGVNRGHGAANDFEGLMYNFSNRSQAVRGAGGVGNNVMSPRIIVLMIDPENESHIFILCGSRDDDFLDWSAQVFLGIIRIGKAARRFDYHLSADRLPRQFGGIFLREDANASSINLNAV